MLKTAKANVNPIRQRSQFTCVTTSTCMALNALGVQCSEDDVNKVIGAKPMQGARWEEVLACAQYFGARATLTTPATLTQVKEWTDAGKPVLIAWNPEGREWSHASLIFDVTGEKGSYLVHIADPNIPNPDKTVRLVEEDEFYSKWFEKWPNYLVRRPALMLDREITSDGRQVMASQEKEASARDKPRTLKGGTIKVPIRGGHVLISQWVLDHVMHHNEVGSGSVFSSAMDERTLIKLAQKAPIKGDGGLHTMKANGVGYDLVMSIEEALSLPDAVQTEVVKEERGRKVTVPAVETSAPLRSFQTDVVTLIVKPSNPKFLPDDAKRIPAILKDVQDGRSYSVLTAFPGDPDVPVASQWGGRFAVVIPNTQGRMASEKPNFFSVVKEMTSTVRHLGYLMTFDRGSSKICTKEPYLVFKISVPGIGHYSLDFERNNVSLYEGGELLKSFTDVKDFPDILRFLPKQLADMSLKPQVKEMTVVDGHTVEEITDLLNSDLPKREKAHELQDLIPSTKDRLSKTDRALREMNKIL